MARLAHGRWWCVAFIAVLVACSDGSAHRPSTPGGGDIFVPSGAGSIIVDLDGPARPFDRRLLGTNAPAWIGPARLADPEFRRQVIDLGATVVRMPGGSWSSSYDWLACENRDETGCYWTWAARPSDYVDFLAATGLEGMWTVSFNETAEQAAALVAFFNGDVDDSRTIGVDANGIDWGTVGRWAALRAANGHPAPQRVRYWEVGNEVFGARPEAGPDCAPFGWEDVWTCDGTAYVEGDSRHDGYLHFRDAMLAVDATIRVGAVGIGGSQTEWGDFGNEVIEGTVGRLDFYVIHNYGFDSTTSYSEVLRRPFAVWEGQLAEPRQKLSVQGADGVPIAVTEYNLFAFDGGDELGLMARAVNALYIADTIGQMAINGAEMANQWNLLNGVSPTGSDYGMIDPDDGTLNPQYFGLWLWSRVGDELLTIESGFDATNELSSYAGRRDDGTVTLLVLNKTDDPIDTKIRVDGASDRFTATADVVSAAGLDAADVTVNGVVGPFTDVTATRATQLGEVTPGGFSYVFPASSIVLISLR